MGTGAVFMSNPTTVLRQYLKQERRGDRSAQSMWEAGRLSMALEVLTQIKILEGLPLTQRSIEVTSALQALLVDQGLMNLATTWYERLDAWRAPRFIGEDPGNASAVGAVSARATLEGGPSRMRRIHSSLLGRRGQDTEPSAESGESDESGEAESTST